MDCKKWLVWKCLRLHNDLRLWYACRNAFVWQHLSAVYVQFVLDNYVLTEHRCSLHPDPLTNGRSPANDAAVQPGVTLDHGTRQDSRPFYTDTFWQ